MPLALHRLVALLLLALALYAAPATASTAAPAAGSAAAAVLFGAPAKAQAAPAAKPDGTGGQVQKAISACDIRRPAACAEDLMGVVNAALVTLLRKIPLLILAILVLLVANWVSRFVGNRLHLIRVRSQNPYMAGLVRMIVRTAIMLVGILIALDLVGLTTVVGAVLGSAGVAGLVLGFAFRDIAENYIAGILLSVRRPFEPGDSVSIDNREGKVISVNSRATVLMTFDGNHLQLPNSLVFKSVVLNYSRNPQRRFEFAVWIDATQSIRRSQTLAMETVAGVEGVLEDPAPSWTVVENGPSGIQLKFYGWVDQRASDLGKVRSEAIRRVKAAFGNAGIEAPRTVYHVLTTPAPQPVDEASEPVLNGHVDTSVNRDIDDQLAEARAVEGAKQANLLDKKS